MKLLFLFTILVVATTVNAQFNKDYQDTIFDKGFQVVFNQEFIRLIDSTRHENSINKVSHINKHLSFKDRLFNNKAEAKIFNTSLDTILVKACEFHNEYFTYFANKGIENVMSHDETLVTFGKDFINDTIIKEVSGRVMYVAGAKKDLYNNFSEVGYGQGYTDSSVIKQPKKFARSAYNSLMSSKYHRIELISESYIEIGIDCWYSNTINFAGVTVLLNMNQYP